NTLVYVRGKGVVVDEPSVLVLDRGGRHQVRAIGKDAMTLFGRTSGDLTAIRPLREGMIRVFDLTQSMLQYFVRKAIGVSHLLKPRAIVTVPCRITPIERRAVRQAAFGSGVRQGQLHLVEKPFAAALGCGLPVFEPIGSMVVDIGGGTTECAVISLGGVVISKAIRIGGVKMDEAITAYVKKEFNILIGDRTAEDVKMNLGSAFPSKEYRECPVRGRDMVTNLPRNAVLGSDMVYEALQPPIQAILSAIRFVLERTPPELAGDVMKGGIHLTGGGANLLGLDQYIASELGIPVLLAKDASACAIQGVGQLTDSFEMLHRIGRSSFLREDEEE
ncbi:MAG: rod shape-determining protein, partial [Clostridia bacterium]|nr:rod shape-determining protein [Clostridia bacterium]